jgi:hypothetical protein
MYKTADQFIADITSSNYFRDNPHVIDEVSIYRWIHQLLQQFGLNIMQKKDFVVKVDKYRGQLPEDFGVLSLAVFCEFDRAKVYGDEKKLYHSSIIKARYEDYYIQSDLVDVCEYKCEDVCPEPKVDIIEKWYIDDSCRGEIYYKNPKYVKLGRDVLRSGCTSDCVNRNVKDSPYSINIVGKNIHANFPEGKLFLEYYATPTDEENKPIIPHTKNGYLEQYLEYAIKRRILEDAMWSKDAKDLFTMFNFTVQQEDILRGRALSDVSNIGMQALWNAINVRRNDMSKFHVNLGVINARPRRFY